MPQLHLSSETACPDARRGRKRIDVPAVRDQRISRIFPLRDRAKVDTLGQLERNVLQAVHGGINTPVQQCLIYLFCKQSLTTNFRKWNIQNLVAGSLDRHKLDRHTRPPPFELGLHPVCLPESECTAASADASPPVVGRSSSRPRTLSTVKGSRLDAMTSRRCAGIRSLQSVQGRTGSATRTIGQRGEIIVRLRQAVPSAELKLDRTIRLPPTLRKYYSYYLE